MAATVFLNLTFYNSTSIWQHTITVLMGEFWRAGRYLIFGFITDYFSKAIGWNFTFEILAR